MSLTTELQAPVLNQDVALLHGAEGDLVVIRISSDARNLEDVLEAVAELPFPINPEIHHAIPQSRVEFPAYSQRVDEVRAILASRGLPGDCLQVVRMFQCGVGGDQ